MALQYLFTKFVDFIQLRKYASYRQHFSNPRLAQQKSLEKILDRTHDCEIRRRLGIESIKSLEDFREKCPITSYEDYAPLMESLFEKDNQAKVLNREEASYFIATSGTTSKPKLFSVTDFYREEFQRVFLAWLGCIKKVRPQAFAGKTLYLADATVVGTSPTGVPFGVLSGYNFRKIPKLLREAMYCTHEHFYELGDQRKKDITLLAHALSAEVTNIGTVMPETVTQFLEKFFDYSDEVLQYMKTGRPPFDYPERFAKSMSLIPNQEAIARMEYLKAQGQWANFYDFFPRLNTIICWKGASAKFYYDKMKNYLPEDVVVWDAIYSASEAVFNLPDDAEVIGGPVAVDGNFLEFRDVFDEQSPLLLVDELELGGEYEVFATTSMGLFRYRINDKIRVTGFREQTPIIEFVEKVGLWLNHAMERITATHVCELMDKVKEKLGLESERLFYFTMCPCHKGDLIHYLVLLETDYPESSFTDLRLDELFFEINPNYKRNIDGHLLGPMRLKILEKGHLKKELQERESSGQTTAQFKYSPIEKDPAVAKALCPCCVGH